MNSLAISLILRLPMAAAALAACLYSGVLARATYLARASDPASIAAAIALIPFNADFILALDGVRPQSSPELLHRALQLNPYQSNAWIHLGLDAELKQADLSAAERYYIEATKADHMYLPHGHWLTSTPGSETSPSFSRPRRRPLHWSPAMRARF